MFSKPFSSFPNDSTTSSQKVQTGVVFFSTKTAHRIQLVISREDVGGRERVTANPNRFCYEGFWEVDPTWSNHWKNRLVK